MSDQNNSTEVKNKSFLKKIFFFLKKTFFKTNTEKEEENIKKKIHSENNYPLW